MKSKMVSILLCLVMVSSIFAAFTQNLGPLSMNASAAGGLADSPWPMFRGNLNHTGLSPYDSSGNNGKEKWSFTTGDKIGSSPAIGSDGTIYVGSSDNKLYAINPDGTEKWNFTIGNRIISSPAIGSDGTIYVGSQDHELYAINSDGTEKWNLTTGSRVQSSPAIGSDGTIYVGSDDFKLYAINPDGTEKWNFTTGFPIQSSPAIGSDGTIYVDPRDDKLHAINPDGSEKWNFTTISFGASSPAIGLDGTIYVGSDDGRFYAINPDGTEKWNLTTVNLILSSPAIGSDGTIYVGNCGNRFYAINPDGTEKWSSTTGDHVHSSPAIGSDGTIYVGSWDNKLYAINPDGTEKWSFMTGWRIASSPAINSDGTIYIGSGDNKLYAIGTTPSIPPIADAGPDQTVNKGDIVQFNGSASYDPDGTIILYEWDFNASDGLWWEDGTPPDAFGPNPTYIYGGYGVFIVTLRVTDNNGSMDTDTCELTVLVPPLMPPILNINVSLDGNDVILYWEPPSTPGIDHYLIYRSTSQINFDFSNVWVNTSSNNESGEPTPIPLRTMWNDTKVAIPGDPSYEQQYYYIIRAVNIFGRISITSRTVGKWTRTFPGRVSTFSLPLEPLETMNTTTDYYLKDMNATYIKWMDPGLHTWMKHGEGAVNDTQLMQGEGYEVKFAGQTTYTFCGMPGSMIKHNQNSFVGFDFNFESDSLMASVNLNGDVTLTWAQPLVMDFTCFYKIYRATERDGFFNGSAVLTAIIPFGTIIWMDVGITQPGTQFYYMIIPENATGIEGTSTYSVGVWTKVFLSEYDTIGIPLKMGFTHSIDWYTNNIPNTQGINFYIYDEQRWGWHSLRMQEGIYDEMLEMAEGYQMSTLGPTKFTFIGI